MDKELLKSLDISKIVNNSNHILLQHGFTLEQINKMTYEEMYNILDKLEEVKKNK